MLKVDIKKRFSDFSLAAEFSIDREILAILGPSGSGKTMTLQCIAGLLKPDEGHIELNGKVLFDSKKEVNLPPQKRNVGFVFQNYALFPHLTVTENIAYGIRNLPANEIKARIKQLLEMVHIQGLASRYPRQLSSGQQQRTALARALATGPEVLLLDEPFSALDAMRREQLEFELLELQNSYKGNMLFVTHDLSQGYKLSSRIAVYESGKVIQFDSKENVIASPASRTVAKLTGFRNLIEGSIVSKAGPEVVINVPGLEQLLKVAAGNCDNLGIDQKATLGIRPEFIRLVDSSGENTVQLRVARVVENIVNFTYYFYIKDNPANYLEVLFPKSGQILPAEGQECYLCLPPEHLVIIKQQEKPYA